MPERANPTTANVLEMLEHNWSEELFLCVGIDPVIAEDFNRQITEAL